MKKFISSLLIAALCMAIIAPQNVSAAVKISKVKATMEVDSTLKLKVSGTESKISWATSKSSIATVSKYGTVTAKKEGNATITATIGSKHYTCAVTVVDSNKIIPTPEPQKKYPDGKYKVGIDIPEGEYVIFADNAESNGYFSLSVNSNENDIIVNDNFDYNTMIYVKNGEYLKLSDAYAVPIESAAVSIDGPGFFKIGTTLPAGEYKVVPDTDLSAYYCIYDDNRQDDIDSNDFFKGETYVTVHGGEYLKLSGCHIKK